MSKPAFLDIKGTVPGITFALHNAQLERIEAGVVPISLKLEPGLYMVREAPQLPPHLFELREGGHYGLVLGPSGRGFYEDTRSRTARAADWVPKPSAEWLPWQKAAPAAAPEPPATPSIPETWLRIQRLTGWSGSETVQPVARSVSIDGHTVWIDLEMRVKAVVFAQVAIRGHRPVNTALPGDGKSRLKLTFAQRNRSIKTEAHLADATANTAAQYLHRGNFEEVKRIMRTLAPPPDTSWLLRAVHAVGSRFKDPVPSVMGRYALLRTGEANWLKELPHAFLNNFDWLADGRVVSAEIAARGGLKDAALTSLVSLPDGRLPLFTDGFSMLLSRLIEFTQDDDPPAEPTAASSALDDTKPDEIRKRIEAIGRARAILASINKWAGCLDMGALTLTFRGADIANPEMQEPVSLDSTWTNLTLPVAATEEPLLA